MDWRKHFCGFEARAEELMATARARSPREEDAGETTIQIVAQGLDQLRETVQLMEQSVEEALRLQEQEVSRMVQEANREVEARLVRLEERVAVLERCLPPAGKRRRVEGAGESGLEARRLPAAGKRRRVEFAGERSAMEVLEERLSGLEASVQRALDTVFPRVNVLVAHLQSRMPHPRMYLPIPSTPSTSASSSSASFVSHPLMVDELLPSTASVSSPPLANPSPRELQGNELIRAAKEGQYWVVRTLLRSGADVNYSNAHGWTPLMSACYRGHERMVSRLILRGANIHASRRLDGWTALHVAAKWAHRTLCVRLLKDAGARVDGVDNAGVTPLHLAADGGNEEAVRALVAAGASVALRDVNGETPLDRASTDAVRRLLQPLAAEQNEQY